MSIPTIWNPHAPHKKIVEQLPVLDLASAERIRDDARIANAWSDLAGLASTPPEVAARPGRYHEELQVARNALLAIVSLMPKTRVIGRDVQGFVLREVAGAEPSPHREVALFSCEVAPDKKVGSGSFDYMKLSLAGRNGEEGILSVHFLPQEKMGISLYQGGELQKEGDADLPASIYPRVVASTAAIRVPFDRRLSRPRAFAGLQLAAEGLCNAAKGKYWQQAPCGAALERMYGQLPPRSE